MNTQINTIKNIVKTNMMNKWLNVSKILFKPLYIIIIILQAMNKYKIFKHIRNYLININKQFQIILNNKKKIYNRLSNQRKKC